MLAHEIAQDGVVIYEGEPGLFEQFRQKSLMTQQQLKAIRREQKAEIAAALQQWGLWQTLTLKELRDLETYSLMSTMILILKSFTCALQLSVVQYPQYIQQVKTYLNLLEDDE